MHKNEHHRLSYLFVIGAPTEIDAPAFEDMGRFIARKIASFSGGCSLSFSEGFWSAEGDCFKESYQDVNMQKNIEISVSVMIDRADSLVDFFKEIAQEAIVLYKFINVIRFIHVESSVVNTSHFEISFLNE